MTVPFTPEQEAYVQRVAATIAGQMIAQALLGAGDRIAEAINGTIVMLPVFHAEDIARMADAPSSGNETYVSGASR